MANSSKIFLVGFSGAGKTTLLRGLKASGREDWSFDDLDQLILQEKKGKSLAEMISSTGWEQFRLWERQYLEGWLKNEGRGVLSLGGGTLSANLYEQYRRNIKFCFLKTPFEVCWNRLISDQTEVRPLVSMGKEELRKVFDAREKVFQNIPWHLDGQKAPSELVKIFWEGI